MEIALRERFEVMCEESGLIQNNQLVYKFFDFHQECGKNTEPMIKLIKEDFYPNYVSHYGIFEAQSTVKEYRTGNVTSQDVEYQII
jgi:hypothetical protein